MTTTPPPATPISTPASPLEPQPSPPAGGRLRGLGSVAGIAISVVALAAVVWWALRQDAPRLPHGVDQIGALAGAIALYAVNTLLRSERWHRLPGVWEAPDEFRPARFSPEQRGRIPKGAYVPFGGGSRICLGMRFGQLEIKTIAAAVTERFRVELPDGFRLRIRQTPTLGPRDGLPVRVRVARARSED